MALRNLFRHLGTAAKAGFGLRKAQYEVAFIIFEKSRGWILEAICREIAAYFPGKTTFHYSSRFLPKAKSYFFAHYSFFAPALKNNPNLLKSKTFVWYTHPRTDLKIDLNETYSALKLATKILCPCTLNIEYLVEMGFPKNTLCLLLGAADPDLFLPRTRTGQGYIGFSTAFYERKRPDRILELVKLLPHRRFILIGRNWRNSPYFGKLQQHENFEYVEAPYSDYPELYRKMDVFVSPSDLEGGPIPLIEAMMSNVVPVASRTGFSADLIHNEHNGYLFDITAPTTEVAKLIERAFENKTNVRESVKHLSWQNFSEEFRKLTQ
jgi:glycosyltransferase involved in cell wall biosynthesis